MMGELYKDCDWLRKKYCKEKLTLSQLADLAGSHLSTIAYWMKKYGIDRRPQGTRTHKLYQDQDWLRVQYLKKKLSIAKVATLADCNRSTIAYWMKKYGIVQRVQANGNSSLYRDQSWLRGQYHEKNLPLEEIAELASCSPGTILYWMKKYNIRRRGNNVTPDSRPGLYRNAEWLEKQYCQNGLSVTEMAQSAGCSRNTIRRWLNEHGIKIKHKYSNPEWLRKQYWEENLTMSEIAKLARCHTKTIYNWMKKYNIKRDKHRGGHRRRENYAKNHIHTNKHWLEKQYVEKKLSQKQIAKLADCHPATVSKWLKRHGIEKRSPQETAILTHGLKTKKYTSKQWLLKQYWDNNLSLDEIGSKCDVSPSTIRKWMVKLDVKRRTQSEAHDAECRQRVSIALKQAWKRGDFDGVFNNPSIPHKRLMVALDELDIEHESEYYIPGFRMPYDMYIPGTRILIEVDGVFWHHSKWAKKQGQAVRDREKTQKAKKEGYELIRITDKEIEERGSRAIVAQEILPYLDQ